jgi:signal transduction histidine kinase
MSGCYDEPRNISLWLPTVPVAPIRWDNRPVAAAVAAFWPRRARSVVPLLPIAYGVVALLVAAAARAPQDLGPTSYAGVSSAAYAVDLVAGLGLLGAAAFALLDPGSARIGWLAFAAGFLWFAPDWEGWTGGPALLRSLGAAAVVLLAAPLALLVADRLPVRGLVRVAAAVLVAVGMARVLVRDPLLDPYCWRDCLSRTFVVHADSGFARDLDHVWEGTTVALALVAVPLALVRLRRATSAILVPAALALAAVAAYAVQLLRRPQENPLDGTFSALFYARALAVAAVAAGVVVAVVLVRRQRAAVARLADELGEAPQPGRLSESLAAAFGDPTLDVAYWLPHARHFVDTSGARVEPPAERDGRAVTPIVRGGDPVAVVTHDPALLGESFERELGSAARLAVENERLQAEVHAQIKALRDSRLRITTRGDAERRGLERDLHDGAQQRLLALGYDLRLAQAAAAREGDEQLAAELATAVEEAQAALEELRQLAHGIYPAVLVEAGLAAALGTLADEAPVAVELGPLPDGRFDTAVEAALYVAVREAIDEAARRGASWVRVGIEGRVRLSVEDDGAPRPAPLVHVADRIGALGGETAFGARSLEAEIPCA